MKKLIFSTLAALSLTCTGVLLSCNNKSNEEAQNAQAIQDATREQLAGALADRDSLLSLVNEISAGMDQIKRLENILTIPGNELSTDQRADIRTDIILIQTALEKRRAQLEELESKLKNSDLSNSKLRKTIETLRMQIDSQAAEIETLRINLEDANQHIGRLTQSVDSLSATVDTVTEERDAARLESVELTNELNQCYYVVASSKELKAHGILQSGFLRKTKIMKGDFDQDYFTTADKRDLNSIPLHSNKAKVLTNQPETSYTIVQANGQKVLRITNKDAFWSLSNYLVVQID